MSEDRIRDSIEKIEPSAGARERMYQNIERKAAAQSNRRTVFHLYAARVILPAAACIAVLLGVQFYKSSRIHSSSSENQELLEYSPYEEAASAEDFQKLGIFIDVPERAQDAVYYIIDGSIACIDFEMDGYAFSVRASEQDGDFSGISGKICSSEQFDSKTDAVLDRVDCAPDTVMRASWSDGKINYVLTNSDGASAEEVKTVARLLIELSGNRGN